MANRRVTKKDVRKSADRKRYYGKTTHNVIRDLKAESVIETLPKVASMIDALAKRGTIHKNKAASLKTRVGMRINAAVYLGNEEDIQSKTILESATDYIELIRTGVSKKSIDHLINATDIPAIEMAGLMETSPRKLAAIKPDTIMEKSQSEKAVSIARLYALGEEIFDSKEEFNKWMNGRVTSLGKKKPKEYLDTISGINLLMDELGRIQHGVYS